MSKYLKKLEEKEINLKAKKQELKELEDKISDLHSYLCNVGQSKSDERNAIKSMQENVEFITLGYKKVVSKYLETFKLFNFSTFLVLVLSFVVGIILNLSFGLPTFVVALSPLIAVSTFGILSFISETKANFAKVKNLRKNTTKEKIETKIKARKIELQKQDDLYDQILNDFCQASRDKSELGPIVNSLETEFDEFKEKCMAGYNAALKELFDSMPTEQKEAYENSVDAHIEQIPGGRTLNMGL